MKKIWQTKIRALSHYTLFNCICPFVTISLLGLFYLWVGMRGLEISIDGFGFIQRAASFPNAFEWVNGFYPLGYPLLLRFGFGVVGDYRLVGNLLSVVAAVAVLASIYGITSQFNFPIPARWLLLLMIGLATPFVQHAAFLGTDMAQLGFVFPALYVLVKYKEPKHLFWGGACLGLAYLMRYTAILFLVPTLALFGARRTWQGATAIVAGFILFALPQLLASTLQTGNPLYNQQAYNVFAGLMVEKGESDLWKIFASAPTNLNWVGLISEYGIAIIVTIIQNMRRIIFEPWTWTGVYFSLLVVPALIWGFLSAWKDFALALLMSWWVVYAFAVSMTFLNSRFLLPLLPITFLLLVSMLLKWQVSRVGIFVILAALLLLETRWMLLTALPIPERRSPTVYQSASMLLNELHAFEPKVVVAALNPSCGGSLFYNLNSPIKQPVAVVTLDESEAQNPLRFENWIQEKGFRFLIIEPCDKEKLAWLNQELPSGFKWIRTQPTFRILEIDPARPE
jgi:hypothetical protein